MSVIAMRPAPINITNIATALLKGPDPDEGVAAEIPDLVDVFVILALVSLVDHDGCDTGSCPKRLHTYWTAIASDLSPGGYKPITAS